MKARYIRQSTKGQNGNLRQLAVAHKDEILFVDIVSGSVPFVEREQGKKLMDAVNTGMVNYVTFHSTDRCGRNTLDVLSTLKALNDKGVTVKIENLGLESISNGKPNPMFGLITTLLAEIASMEKANLLERQKEGIAVARAKALLGNKVYKGRVIGTTESKTEVLGKYTKVVKMLNLYPTLSLEKIARLSTGEDEKKISPNTVRKVKNMLLEK